jgi:hypothetical protein
MPTTTATDPVYPLPDRYEITWTTTMTQRTTVSVDQLATLLRVGKDAVAAASSRDIPALGRVGLADALAELDTIHATIECGDFDRHDVQVTRLTPSGNGHTATAGADLDVDFGLPPHRIAPATADPTTDTEETR